MSREIRARSFVIRDAEGRERACLQFAPRTKDASKYSSPTLQLFGSNGQVRFNFRLDDQRNAPILRVMRADGQMAMFLSTDKDGNIVVFEPRDKKQPPILLQTWHFANGEGDGGTVEFYNPQGMPQVGFAIWPEDSPGMRLYDPNGQPFESDTSRAEPLLQPIACLSQRPVRPASQDATPAANESPALEADAFQLFDDNNCIRAGFGLIQEANASSKGAALEFHDLKGTVRATMCFNEDQDRPSMTLCDAAGNVMLYFGITPEGTLLQLLTSQEDKSIIVSVGNPREGRAGASGVNLRGSDGIPRVLFGEHRRGGGISGAQDETGQKALIEIR